MPGNNDQQTPEKKPRFKARFKGRVLEPLNLNISLQEVSESSSPRNSPPAEVSPIDFEAGFTARQAAKVCIAANERYSVTRELLGAGAYGTVNRCDVKDSISGINVALAEKVVNDGDPEFQLLKVIQAGLNGSAKGRIPLLVSPYKRTVGRRSSAFFVPIFELGSLDAYLDKFSGMFRSSRLDATRVPAVVSGFIYCIMVQTIEGLYLLHNIRYNDNSVNYPGIEQGAQRPLSPIIHNDIKPANILLERSKDGGIEAVIADFGQASSVTVANDIAFSGTIAYMAPEKAVYRPDHPRYQSDSSLKCRFDIWSLGLVLHELLGLDHPFGRVVSQIDLMVSSLAYLKLEVGDQEQSEETITVLREKFSPQLESFARLKNLSVYNDDGSSQVYHDILVDLANICVLPDFWRPTSGELEGILNTRLAGLFEPTMASKSKVSSFMDYLTGKSASFHAADEVERSNPDVFGFANTV
jgi:serine/threonine protein kinase